MQNQTEEMNVGTLDNPVILVCCEDNFWREVIIADSGAKVVIAEKYFCWLCMDFHPQV